MKKSSDTTSQAKPTQPSTTPPVNAAPSATPNVSTASNPAKPSTAKEGSTPASVDKKPAPPAAASKQPSSTSPPAGNNASASPQTPGTNTSNASASPEAVAASGNTASSAGIPQPDDKAISTGATSKPQQPPIPSSTGNAGGYGMQPRLHVPSPMATVAAAIQGYVSEIEPESIADDLAHHRRIHHAVAHPSLDSHVLFLPSTSLSTVNSLLDDALKHLTALAPAEEFTLEDKYHDIWSDIEADRAKRHRDLLTRHFRAWAAAAKVRHAAGRLGQQGHKRRVARCFRAWRRRSCQRHHVAVKFALAMQACRAGAFHKWATLHSRSRLVKHKYTDARARRFKGLFLVWKHHTTRRRVVQTMASKHDKATIGNCFQEWKAAAAVRRHQRRAINRLGHTLGIAQVGRRFAKWKKQVALLQVSGALRNRRHQRTREVQRTVFQRWRRRARLVVIAGHRFNKCRRRQLVECFRDWKDRWHHHRTVKPATWTCETVGLWLGALFQLPPDAARACQVAGHELLSLPSRLSLGQRHPTAGGRDPVLERLLPSLPLFFCSAEHCLQLMDGIASLSKTSATRLSKDIMTQHRLAKLDAVTDFLSLRHWCAQDRELIMYVRQLDAVGAPVFLHLDREELAVALKCHRPEHVALLKAGQERLRSVQGVHPSKTTKFASQHDDAVADDHSFSLSAWLESMRLSQYEPAFRQHDISSVAQLTRLTPDILRHTLHIQSKLHRDRILEFAADLAATTHRRTNQAPAFRLQLALSHVDQPPPRTVPQPNATSSKKSTTSASLAKQVRTLFFSICRWLEGQTPPHHATLDRLFAAMQATSQGQVTKASFAHGLRALNAGFTSAHVHAMWENLPKAKTDGRVGYEAFVRFFIGIFEQRRAMLHLAIQSLGGATREGRGDTSHDGTQLSQLLHALARSEDILARAGVVAAR